MLGSMTQQEYIEWRVFASHEPIGDARLDALFALLTRALFQVNAGKRRVPKWDKFIPKWWGENKREEQSSQQILGFVAALTRGFGEEVPPVVEELINADLDREDDGDSRPGQ